MKGGNTPTCVGKTAGPLLASCWTWKHPHVRGEDYPSRCRRPQHRETPPRAWGRPGSVASKKSCKRNTPTCVGKTEGRISLPISSWKHPHVRGEDGIISYPGLHVLETPPRAWGRRRIEKSPLAEKGNTPTCVGKTNTVGFRRLTAQKHPHVRGEDRGE